MIIDSKTFGKKIKEIRRSKKWTQTELGDKVGLPHQEISRIENGQNNIGIETLAMVAYALGYEIDLVKKRE